MIPYMIMILSLILDGVLSNFLPYLVGDLSWFTPCFTIVSILIIYPFYHKEAKKYLITVFVLGLIYDLFYTNMLFYNAVLFTGLGFLIYYFQNNVKNTFVRIFVETILLITVYEVATGILLWGFQLVPITFQRVFYKLSHSLVLNILYAEILYGIIQLLPKKYKKTSMN